ncbi:hypothetical protein PTTG_29528, partial [Puccinia triticina 1-1 BBBD Race 1]
MSLMSEQSPQETEETGETVVNGMQEYALWKLPEDLDEFHTFIDHGCKLDRQQYPIYPNGQTTYVRPPGADIRNFGTVGFTKRTGTENRMNPIWKTNRAYCLGALVCNIPTCMWVGSPPTAAGGIKAYMQGNPKCMGSARKCPGKVLWLQCEGTATRFDYHRESGWAVLRHRGVHQHPWPEAKKPDKLAREDLKAEVAKNPLAGALKLKLGKVAIDQPIIKVTDIHQSFVNSDRLRYYRRVMLRELGIAPDKLGAGVGNKFILDMFRLNAQGLHVILVSFREDKEHFAFQTPWMGKRLLARDSDNQVYQGGFISDVTYRFFENGYLLTTSMFCEQIERWIPVQLTWIRGLSIKYYQIHFTALFQQFAKSSITRTERKLYARQIVDFLKAQAEGFKLAYMDVFGKSEEEAQSMLKGCRQHFRANVIGVRRNRAIIPADRE